MVIGRAGCRSPEGGVGEEMRGGGDSGCHRWTSSPGAGRTEARPGRFKGEAQASAWATATPSHATCSSTLRSRTPPAERWGQL